MDWEVKYLETIETWTLFDRPRSRKVFFVRSALAVKKDAMGQQERLKAQLAVKLV